MSVLRQRAIIAPRRSRKLSSSASGPSRSPACGSNASSLPNGAPSLRCSPSISCRSSRQRRSTQLGGRPPSSTSSWYAANGQRSSSRTTQWPTTLTRSSERGAPAGEAGGVHEGDEGGAFLGDEG
eukprot:1702205-Prymnesium_polylepis.1